MPLSLFVLGFMSMTAQAVFLREMLVVFRGGELIFGIALLSWLLWTSSGSWVTGKYINKFKKPDDLFYTLMPIYGLSGFAGYLSIRNIAYIARLVPGEQVSYDFQALTALMAFGLFNLFGGALFVLGAKYLGRSNTYSTDKAYTIEAAGSAAAGIIVSLILIYFYSNYSIALIFTSLGFIAGLAGLIKKLSLIRTVVFLLCALLFFQALRYEQKVYGYYRSGQNILKTVDTKYGRLTVTENAGQTTFYSDSLPLFSYPDPETAEYAVHIPMLACKNPRNILILGGGPGGIFDEVLRYESVNKITGVELDPEIFNLSKKYLQENWSDNPKVKTVAMDGRAFLQHTGDTYDVIIMNMPPPLTGLANRYYTSEFFRLVSKRLSENGVFGFSVIGADNYYPDDIAYYIASIRKTLQNSFGSVFALPGVQCRILAGKKQAMFDSLDWEILEIRRIETGIETSFVRDYYLKYIFSPERIRQTESALDRQTSLSVNSDTKPVGYFLRTIIQGSMDFSKITSIVGKLAKRNTLFAFMGLGVILILLAGFAPGKNKIARSVVSAIVSLGLTEISLEIIAIMAFQSVYGFLYGRIALLTGAYMAGLAAGGWFGTKTVIKNKGDKQKILATVQTGIAVIPVAWAVLLFVIAEFNLATTLEPVFFILTIMAGLAGGFQFPIADSFYREKVHSGGENIGMIYAVDLAGSGVGALVTASLIVPVLGMNAAFMFLVIINICSASGLSNSE